MLLILEIYLTVQAWKKGWKGWALVAWPICLALAMALGLGSAGSGGSEGSAILAGLLGDLFLIGVLAAMTLNPRTGEQPSQAQPDAAQPTAGRLPLESPR